MQDSDQIIFGAVHSITWVVENKLGVSLTQSEMVLLKAVFLNKGTLIMENQRWAEYFENVVMNNEYIQDGVLRIQPSHIQVQYIEV